MFGRGNGSNVDQSWTYSRSDSISSRKKEEDSSDACMDTS